MDCRTSFHSFRWTLFTFPPSILLQSIIISLLTSNSNFYNFKLLRLFVFHDHLNENTDSKAKTRLKGEHILMVIQSISWLLCGRWMNALDNQKRTHLLFSIAAVPNLISSGSILTVRKFLWSVQVCYYPQWLGDYSFATCPFQFRMYLSMSQSFSNTNNLMSSFFSVLICLRWNFILDWLIVREGKKMAALNKNCKHSFGFVCAIYL